MKKENMLAGTGYRRTKKLLDMSEQLADLKFDYKELHEAIQAVQAALQLSSKSVQNLLGSQLGRIGYARWRHDRHDG